MVDDDDDDDDDVAFLPEDSFTLAYCALFAARSFQTNSGELSLSLPAVARYLRMLWAYSSSSLWFCALDFCSFEDGMAARGLASTVLVAMETVGIDITALAPGVFQCQTTTLLLWQRL